MFISDNLPERRRYFDSNIIASCGCFFFFFFFYGLFWCGRRQKHMFSHQGAKVKHFDVSNVIYHKFSHGAVSYTLNGENVNVMLEYRLHNDKMTSYQCRCDAMRLTECSCDLMYICFFFCLFVVFFGHCVPGGFSHSSYGLLYEKRHIKTDLGCRCLHCYNTLFLHYGICPYKPRCAKKVIDTVRDQTSMRIHE